MDQLVFDRPMSQSDFYKLSSEDKLQYVNKLSDVYNASCHMIADMLNMNQKTLYAQMSKLGYKFNTKKGARSSTELDAWERFLGRETVSDKYVAPGNTYDYSKSSQTLEEIANSIEDNKDRIESLNLFISECCTVGSNVMETRLDILFDVYKSWCGDNEFLYLPRKEFSDYIKDNLNTLFDKSKGYVYCNNIYLKMDVFNKYRSRMYSLKPNQSPYYNPNNKVEDKKENQKEKHKVIKPDKKKDKNSTIINKFDTNANISEVASEQKSEPKFKVCSMSGTLEYEGSPCEILADVMTKKLDIEKKMRIRIQWEVID